MKVDSINNWLVVAGNYLLIFLVLFFIIFFLLVSFFFDMLIFNYPVFFRFYGKALLSLSTFSLDWLFLLTWKSVSVGGVCGRGGGEVG